MKDGVIYKKKEDFNNFKTVGTVNIFLRFYELNSFPEFFYTHIKVIFLNIKGQKISHKLDF